MSGSSGRTPQGRARQARQEYELGLAFFRKKHWKSASRHFALAEHGSRHDDAYLHLYSSYHGLCLVLSGDVSGLNLCRHAASMETIQATVFMNLSLAEFRFRHRRRACSAMKLGLAIDPAHAGLNKLRRKKGIRRSPCLAFLRRENPLNKWLGKVTYRHANASATLS